MQACEAYYQDGRFVPLEMLNIPEGSRAIVTILDAGRDDISRRQIEAMRRFYDENRDCDEPIPEFERIHFQEIDI